MGSLSFDSCGSLAPASDTTHAWKSKYCVTSFIGHSGKSRTTGTGDGSCLSVAEAGERGDCGGTREICGVMGLSRFLTVMALLLCTCESSYSCTSRKNESLHVCISPE